MSEVKKPFSEYDKPKPLSEHLAQKKREQQENSKQPMQELESRGARTIMTIDTEKSWAESAIDGIVGSIRGTIDGLGEDGRGFKRDGEAFAARNFLELSRILRHWSTIARQEGALWALVHHERFPEKQWCELEPQSGDEES